MVSKKRTEELPQITLWFTVRISYDSSNIHNESSLKNHLISRTTSTVERNYKSIVIGGILTTVLSSGYILWVKDVKNKSSYILLLDKL